MHVCVCEFEVFVWQYNCCSPQPLVLSSPVWSTFFSSLDTFHINATATNG
jgi:hypothetical protein